MKQFNGYIMRGVTEKDNQVILKHNKKQIELFVDDFGRVFNEGGRYIADAKETEEGNGIYCN
jgi:predicted RNA-binding protein YlqC (UPF0109 family)